MYISDDASTNSSDEARFDPEENRLRIAETSGEQESRPLTREDLLRTDPNDTYLSALVTRARRGAGGGGGGQRQQPNEEERRRALQNALPFPDRPIVPPQLPDSENPELDLPDGDERRCVTCLSREVKAMCTPCGHTSVCSVCAQAYLPMIRQDLERGEPLLDGEIRAKCPMCRARIRQMIQPYGAVVAPRPSTTPSSSSSGRDGTRKHKAKKH
jgi:hypothetical protein